MTIGYIGLGKMGYNQVLRLLEKGHKVVVFDADEKAREKAERAGAETAASLKELPQKLIPPRLIWIMIPHTAVDEVLNELNTFLRAEDTVIDGGNSFYKDSIRRAKELKEKGINFLDVGVSGGPAGARYGACLMIGGEEQDYRKFEQLFRDLAAERGYGYMGRHGAGHFVKMVHNGIEYGMMQAIAEGFSVLKRSEFNLNLEKIAELFNHGSVIESRLIRWLKEAYNEFGEDLTEVSGTVQRTGEGDWAVKTAEELEISVPVLKEALKFRIESEQNPSYTGKILSALRNQFGGHKVKNEQDSQRGSRIS